MRNMRIGFRYRVELRDEFGLLLSVEEANNIIPEEGLNHLLATEWGVGAKINTWYIGLYGGNYTPQASDVMVTFPSTAVEFTNYSAATRLTFVPGSPLQGGIDNGASPATFVFSGLGAPSTVYGAFLSSSNVKGGTAGVLSSAVKFPSSKAATNGANLIITLGILGLSS